MKTNDLGDRVLDYGVAVLELCMVLGNGIEARSVRSQLSRSATSVGANYMESQSAHSKADFISKLQISLKELRESKYWLEIIRQVFAKSNGSLAGRVSTLIRESEELLKIINSCSLTAKGKMKRSV